MDIFEVCLLARNNLLLSKYKWQKGDEAMNRIEESIANQSFKCSKCGREIMDEREYHDNNGVCDDCYSISLRKSRGLIIN